MLVVFFFSSRRRHTRLSGDWSSDVCSSDLEGITVSLSSVERTIRWNKLTHWKKKQASYYTFLPRPISASPGALVQVDTIHFIKSDKTRFYIYAVIDIYSRLGYAEYHPKLSQSISHQVIIH